MIWVVLANLGVPVWLVIGAVAASLWSRRASPGDWVGQLQANSPRVGG